MVLSEVKGTPPPQQRQDVPERLLAHAVHQQVGAALGQDARQELVLPIVVVCQPPHRSLDPPDDHRNVRIQPLEGLRVHRGRIVGTGAGFSPRGERIVRAASSRRRVVIDHRVHVAPRYPEEQAGTPQPAQLVRVAPPVGLGDDAYAETFRLDHSSDDGRGKRGMVHVRIARDEDHIQTVPAQPFHLLSGGRQEKSRIELRARVHLGFISVRGKFRGPR